MDLYSLSTSSLLNETLHTSSLPSHVIFLLTVPVFIIAVCANLAVIVGLSFDSHLRSSCGVYVYFYSLAIADLLVASLALPGFALTSYLGHWPLGFYSCVLWILLDTSSCSISVHHLCLIAWDRYEAISSPHGYRMKRTTSKRFSYSVITWIFSIAQWLPIISTHIKDIEDRLQKNGECLLLTRPLATTVQCLMSYILPMVILLVLYSLSLNYLCKVYSTNKKKSHSKGIVLKSNKDDASEIETIIKTTTTSKHLSENMNSQLKMSTEKLSTYENKTHGDLRRQQSLHGIRLLSAVIGGLFLCWLPFCIAWLIITYCGDCVPASVYEFTFWLAYLNSALNPILYFIINKNYRSAFVRIWRRIITKKL